MSGLKEKRKVGVVEVAAALTPIEEINQWADGMS